MNPRFAGFEEDDPIFTQLRLVSRRFRAALLDLFALRFTEWQPMLDAIDTLDLSLFEYISIRLPSRMTEPQESVVVESLDRRENRGWPLILHPDAVTNWSRWRCFGRSICIENMDTRKLVGRTDRELELIFDRLPDARLCFDIGDAWQVDPTMGEAYRILKSFGSKLRQLHLREVN